jgi:excinuclease UvrABC nuclease subunit
MPEKQKRSEQRLRSVERLLRESPDRAIKQLEDRYDRYLLDANYRKAERALDNIEALRTFITLNEIVKAAKKSKSRTEVTITTEQWEAAWAAAKKAFSRR